MRIRWGPASYVISGAGIEVFPCCILGLSPREAPWAASGDGAGLGLTCQASTCPDLASGAPGAKLPGGGGCSADRRPSVLPQGFKQEDFHQIKATDGPCVEGVCRAVR